MSSTKSRNAIIIVASILVAVILIVIIVGLSIPEEPEIIQGQAETTDYRVSCKVPSRVLAFRVHEGDAVQAGDTLVIMEAPDIQAKLAQAQAAYNAAQAQEQKALNGSRQEQIQGAYETWQKAIAGREVAEKTYNRVRRLCEKGVMPDQKLDEAKANYDASLATEKAAKSQYDMAVNGARYEDKAAAGAQALRAQGAVDEMNSYVNETVLLATAPGVVTEIFPEVGELVGTGAPIMNIAVIDDIWFTFNVREDLLPGLEVGTVTDVYVPAMDQTVPVTITRLKDVGSFAAWKATKALGSYDLRTIEMRATPNDPAQVRGLRSGMSAIIQK